MRTAYAGLAGLITGTVITTFVKLADANTRVENSLKVAGLAGAELERVYDRLFESAQRNAAPIEALTELYGRASQVQKELNITTEELLGFTDKIAVALRVSGKSASESSGALLQLSQALGSGIVRAEEFNSILEGALPVAQAAAAGLEEAGGSVSKLRNLVIEGKVSSEAFFRAFEAGSVILEEKVADAELTVSQGFVRLINVLIRAAGQFDESTGASELLAGALNDLAGAIEAAGNWFQDAQPAIRGFMGLLRDTVGWAGALANILPKAVAPSEDAQLSNIPGFDAFISSHTIASTTPRGPSGRGGRRGARPSATGAVVNTVSLSDFDVPDGGSKAAKAAQKLAEAYRDITRDARQFIDAQMLEAQRLGMTEQAANRLRFEQELLNEAANDNIPLTSAQRAELSGLAAEMAAAEERTRQLTEAFEFGGSVTKGILSDIKTELMNGTSVWGSFAAAGINALDSIADRALSMAADGIWNMIFGAFTGGLGGGMGGAWNIPTGFQAGGFFPSFAGGGFTGTGSRYGGIDGMGGFPAILHPNETVVDHTAANGNGPNININIDARGATRDAGPEIARQVRAVLPDAMREYERNNLRRAG